MCKAMQELMAESRAEGKAEGKAEGMRELVVELLKELGALSEELHYRIQQENDLQVLRGWNRLAARAESIREFEMAM